MRIAIKDIRWKCLGTCGQSLPVSEFLTESFKGTSRPGGGQVCNACRHIRNRRELRRRALLNPFVKMAKTKEDRKKQIEIAMELSGVSRRYQRINKQRELKKGRADYKERRMDIKSRLSSLLSGAKQRANRKEANGISCPFDIDREYLLELWEAQNGCSKISGKAFDLEDMEGYTKNPYGPSLDRIDSNGGYTKGNVQIICVIENMAKGEYSQDFFLDWIDDSYEYRHIQTSNGVDQKNAEDSNNSPN